MVKPIFKNLPIECFWHPHQLGSTDRPALCLFHDTKEAGQPLILALDELEAEGCPSKRAVTFRPCERKKAFTTLKLRLVAESDELRVMQISHDGASATVEMTSVGLAIIRRGIEDWLKGDEDFGVNPKRARKPKRKLGQRDRDSAELWFWGPYYYAP